MNDSIPTLPADVIGSPVTALVVTEDGVRVTLLPGFASGRAVAAMLHERGSRALRSSLLPSLHGRDNIRGRQDPLTVVADAQEWARRIALPLIDAREIPAPPLAYGTAAALADAAAGEAPKSVPADVLAAMSDGPV